MPKRQQVTEPKPGPKTSDVDKQVTHTLEECRMILPGIQALFGFQLVAVFNQAFGDLAGAFRGVHLAALVAVAVATGLVMTPAAYHRQVEPEEVSESFVHLASRLLVASMAFLGAGMAMDLFVVAFAASGSMALAAVLAGGLFALLAFLWFVMPASRNGAGRRVPGGKALPKGR